MWADNEGVRICEALAGLAGIRHITRGWPKLSADGVFPCVAVQKAGERGVGWWDDAETLTELEYYVRIFARTAAQADEAAVGVNACMLGLGYRRVFAWEDADEETHQRIFRYAITG